LLQKSLSFRRQSSARSRALEQGNAKLPFEHLKVVSHGVV